MNLKASTLPEVLGSLSLLGLLLGLGFHLAGQLGGIRSPVQQYQTRALVRELLYSPLDPFLETETEVFRKGRRLVRRVRPWEQDSELWLVEVSCFYGTQLLEKHSSIVFFEPSFLLP